MFHPAKYLRKWSQTPLTDISACVFLRKKKRDTCFRVVLKKKNKAPALPLFDISPLHLPADLHLLIQGYPHICTGTTAGLQEPGVSHPTCCFLLPQTCPVARCRLNYCCHRVSGLCGCTGGRGRRPAPQSGTWTSSLSAPTAPGHAAGRSSKNPQVLLGPESAGRGWGARSRNTTHVCTFCSDESQVSSPPSEAPEMTHVPLCLETPRCTTLLCLYVAE